MYETLSILAFSLFCFITYIAYINLRDNKILKELCQELHEDNEALRTENEDLKSEIKSINKLK